MGKKELTNNYNRSFFHLHSGLQGLMLGAVSSDANFVILDPLNLSNNTTKNSYRTKDILAKFQSAFNNLKSLMLQQLPSEST